MSQTLTALPAAPALRLPEDHVSATLSVDQLAKETIPEQYAAAVAAGLKDILALPGQDSYEASVSSYWSEAAQLRPWLVAQPRTTQELSLLLGVVTAIPELRFAVRSGAHMFWAGSNNIANGVTIDLSRMASVSYDSATNLASLAPGARWGEVYSTLEASGVAVAGAPDASVGVAGFLLGGGISPYAARVGLACNTVVNYEVVLADGSIVNANKTENADLWRALKGGGNNFGIVSRFDVEAFPKSNLWGGDVVHDRAATAEVIDAFTEFTAAHNTDTNMATIFTHTPTTKDITAITTAFNLDGIADAPIFDSLRSIGPQLSSLGTTTLTEAARHADRPSGEHATWYTLTYRNNAAVSKFMAAKHEELVSYLNTVIADGAFSTRLVLQPLPAAATAQGNNVLGLDAIKDDAVVMLFSASVQTAEQRALAASRMEELFAEMQRFAEDAGALCAWEYLNYANPAQSPLESYGEENVRVMKEVAGRYDPEGVFQTRCPGGFKVSEI